MNKQKGRGYDFLAPSAKCLPRNFCKVVFLRKALRNIATKFLEQIKYSQSRQRRPGGMDANQEMADVLEPAP
jgi:hypothetical protein